MEFPFWGGFWGLLERLGAVFGASWAVLERREAENTTKLRSFKHIGKSIICASLGPPGKPLGGILGRLGASWTGIEAPKDPKRASAVPGTQHVPAAGEDLISKKKKHYYTELLHTELYRTPYNGR